MSWAVEAKKDSEWVASESARITEALRAQGLVTPVHRVILGSYARFLHALKAESLG